MGLWIHTIYTLLVIILPRIDGLDTEPLSEWVGKYSGLTYDRSHIHTQHKKHVSDLKQKLQLTPVEISFYSDGRWFHLLLHRDEDTISPHVVVEQPDHIPESFHTDHLYHGTLADEPSSRVFGSVVDGVFEGVIDSPKHGKYHVERAHKYFTPHTHFHSVMYHEDDVSDPHVDKRTGHKSGCGVSDEVSEWMRSIQESGAPTSVEEVEEEDPEALKQMEKDFKEVVDPQLNSRNPTLYSKYKNLYHQLHADMHSKYSAEANSRGHRSKRSFHTGGVGSDNQGTCTLSVQTDPLLWRYIYQQEKNDSIKTRDEITAMVSQHIKAVNHIYGDVIFHGKYKHKGIRFEVQRIKIDDDSSCRRYGSFMNTETNKFCRTNVDVSNFLNLHSQTNHDDFCLSYVFTFRDFTGGTLGLAWVASPSGASGGICEKYKTYTENLAGRRHTEKRSLNTGIITFLNYNSRVPPKVSQLTLAHEIGHNFGSPHDFPSSCKPGGREGNYIMFSSATSGDRYNNNKFSNCSIRNISQVLDAIAENRRKNCFKATNGTFCGNKIVEDGEECDCGYDNDDCEEKNCCYPRLISDTDRLANSTAKMCSRRYGTQCSPSEGPCCNQATCTFEQDIECHSFTDCTMSASCNGRKATCPSPQFQKNFRPCNQDTKVCLDGECRGSICLAHNMSECFLTSDVVLDKKKLCEIACQVGNDPTTCKSTSELNIIFPIPVFMRPGAPCNNFQGYCDVFQKCRAVDAEGPLASLKNLLFNEATLRGVSDWVEINWYWVVFLSVGFILVMGMFIKCCAVHTPSSNPRKPPARSITQTLRRPVSTLRRVKRRQPGASSGGGRSVGGGGQEAMQLQQQRGRGERNGGGSRPSGRDRGGRSNPSSNNSAMSPLPGPSGHNNRRRSSNNSNNNRSSMAPPLPPAVTSGNLGLPPLGFSTDDPPPPYPGIPSAGPPPSIPASAPIRHGYGEGRGHYNRPKASAPPME